MERVENDLRVLRYVAEITRKLARMLSQTRYHMLVYFLEMTAIEADNLAAEQDAGRAESQTPPE